MKAHALLLIALSLSGTIVGQDWMDETFGTDGYSTFGENGTWVSDMVITSTGEYVVTGEIGPSPGRLFVARLANDGALDAAFGTGGLTVLQWGQGSAGSGLLVLEDGGLLVCGGGTSGSNESAAFLVKFRADGTLDMDFGDNGLLILGSGYQYAASDLAMDQDDRVVVCGYEIPQEGEEPGIAVWRSTSTGELDPEFDEDGVVALSFGGLAEQARSIAVQGGNRYVLTVYATLPDSVTRVQAVRLTEEGQIDPMFGGSEGMLTGPEVARCSLVDDQGEIFIGSSVWSTQTNLWAVKVSKFDADGEPIADFGIDGSITSEGITGDHTWATSMALGAAGSLLVGCVEGYDASQPMLLRFAADGTIDPDLGGTGVLRPSELSILSGGFGAQGIGQDESGRILMCGTDGLQAVAMAFRAPSTGILDQTAIPGFIVYPVPADRSITIAPEGVEAGLLVLSDPSGRYLRSGILGPHSAYVMDVADLASGHYTLRLDSGHGTIAKSMVIQH